MLYSLRKKWEKFPSLPWKKVQDRGQRSQYKKDGRHAYMPQTNSNDIPSPMQTSSVVTEVVNNFLLGDVFISVRNEQGTEITQMYPVRIEEVYVHSWYEDDNTEDCMCSNRVYCKFKMNSRLTHPMNMDVFSSLFGSNLTLMTFHLMPYNFQVLGHETMQYLQLTRSLKDFIFHAFPEIPKRTVHNYEALKTGETVGIKRKREE